MMNIGVSVKKQMIGVLVKMIIYGILVRAIASVIKHVKLTNTQISKLVRAKTSIWQITISMLR